MRKCEGFCNTVLCKVKYVPIGLCDSTAFDFYVNFYDPKKYDIVIVEGYLARKRKDGKLFRTGNAYEFFHRFFFRDELNQLTCDERKKIHIHHKNGIKLDNRCINLKMMDGKAHFKLHKDRWAR